MSRLSELILGKLKPTASFDPTKPEGAFKLCGCGEFVVQWHQERCKRCVDVAQGRVGDVRSQSRPPDVPHPRRPLEHTTTYDRPPPEPPVYRASAQTKVRSTLDRTGVSPVVRSELSITLRLKPGVQRSVSPLVRVLVGDEVCLEIDPRDIRSHYNSYWEVDLKDGGGEQQR